MALAIASCGEVGVDAPDAANGDDPDASAGDPDAAINAPDAMPGTPDAIPGTPDAMGDPDAMIVSPYDYHVDAVNGDDANDGSVTQPFKTLTRACSVAGNGDSIKVMPGTYNAANGETFPITVPAGVLVEGDVANEGNGAPPTSIAGDAVVPGEGGTLRAALILSGGAEIAGLRFDVGGGSLTFAVFQRNVTTSIHDNFFRLGYGGVRLTGSGSPTITGNTFDSAFYGVYAVGFSGGGSIASNVFQNGPNLPIDLSGGSLSITGNTILGSGQVGVQVQGGSPTIAGNEFTSTTGYTYGCVNESGTSEIRDNTCPAGDDQGILIDASGNPDLGTAGDPGGNTFTGAGGPAIRLENASDVAAIGNTFASNPPVCGADIVVTGAGTVTWSAAGDACPDGDFDIYVDAVNGDDGNTGGAGDPYETLTAAMAAAGNGDRVKVRPGTYNAANGETFPITVPAGVLVEGDVANQGNGASPTSIAGDAVVPGEGGTLRAALILSGGAEIAGLRFDVGGGGLTFAVFQRDVTTSIHDNFFRLGYGSIRLTGSGNPTITDNTFDTASYGIYATGFNGGGSISSNVFEDGPNLPIDLGGTNTLVIAGNTILGSGLVGIQVQGGSPTITGNEFTNTGGYSVGCVRVRDTPTLRDNTCYDGSVQGILIDGDGDPDLGTANDPGGNTFFAGSGPSVLVGNSATVSAIGNTWPSNPPACGTDIDAGSGTVIWGGGGQSCP